MNRLELSSAQPGPYHKIDYRPAAVEALFVQQFLEAHRVPPAQIVLDLDATDDPLHGHQEGRFFDGYFDGYCYLPLYIVCGRHLLAAMMRRANIDASDWRGRSKWPGSFPRCAGTGRMCASCCGRIRASRARR